MSLSLTVEALQEGVRCCIENGSLHIGGAILKENKIRGSDADLITGVVEVGAYW